ncbi:hybrid sensor histidine kinase/response regulator [Halorubrum ezzemoulense]|jgi:PAS domain S-box-containing protein|uniref:histidine kinase n=1 Tax=Halorubrum ezzemoulense TaxID=337243 RepID=A0A256J3A8_HALEZ|nr:response regulator [Halorubrum ezzemoulense]MDB2261207.1 response regulator [Halorubrum ezzemoulense]MDB2264469.1 response regulator [Halorubrum ezzemoulense]MDB2267675.1 response regulator [Halorubrum ezzemoulense]MDB2270540.1 response regulator [Halorubrum ezzemoulense]MDB9281553.1 response regulator [Halorubrum ezzemoulense]
MSIDNPNEAATASIEVLHVDDDPAFLDLTKSFIERELGDVEITTVASPDAVLDTLDERSVHCVVSDYEMPGTDGLELLDAVRDHYADLPFILYTGKGSEEIAAQAINAGVTGYLQKGGPDQHRRLANRVKHAATEYRAQIESERYSTVLRALDYPIYVVNAEAEFEYVNEAFLDLVGYDREAIIGSPPGKIKTDEGVQRANDMLATIVSSAGPETQQFRVDIHTKDGETVPCYDHMAALPFDDEFRGSVGILRDATREQRQREELIRQNKRLDEFTSIVSHDLRTPLQNAKTAAEMARAESEATHFEALEREHERMEQMIDELLTLAKEGESVSEPEPVDVGALAAEAWKPFGCPADTLDVVDDEITVSGDRSRIRRLLENLFRNVDDHCGSPVTVTIGASADGFYVADDGPGLDETDCESVFEAGYTTATDGTGFGLTIVERIADAHGWDISVGDSASGGVRFDVTVDPAVPVTDDVPVSP